MSSQEKCTVRRPVTKKYLGRYIGGQSWIKCGRVVVVCSLNKWAKPYCRQCAQEAGIIEGKSNASILGE